MKSVFTIRFLINVALLVVSAIPVNFVHSQEADAWQLETEVVASGLTQPSDFSVSPDGETVFLAELQSKQIRRLSGDSNEVVIAGVETEDQSPVSLAVFALDGNRVMVGAAGFSSPKSSVTLFNLASAKTFPLDFNENQVPATRAYQRAIKRIGAFDVLKFFQQQRGVSMVRRIGDAPLSVCDVRLKDGGLSQLLEDKYVSPMPIEFDSNTLAVDPLGGYFVSLGSAEDGEKHLAFTRAEGTLLQTFALGQTPVVSVGFVPNTRRLYALVTGASSGSEDDSKPNAQIQPDGVYEILSNDQRCSTKLVLALDGPQVMKIDNKGQAWVLCKSGDAADSFKLIKVKGLDSVRSTANEKVGVSDGN